MLCSERGPHLTAQRSTVCRHTKPAGGTAAENKLWRHLPTEIRSSDSGCDDPPRIQSPKLTSSLSLQKPHPSQGFPAGPRNSGGTFLLHGHRTTCWEQVASTAHLKLCVSAALAGSSLRAEQCAASCRHFRPGGQHRPCPPVPPHPLRM